MSRETIVAPDIQSALKQVKKRFGDDAMILETRTRRQRRTGSLALAEQVEVHVSLPERSPSGMDGESGGGPRTLSAELERFESLLAQIEGQIGAEAASQGHGSRYPLAAPLEELGLRPAAIRRLAAGFAEEVPPASQWEIRSAMDHLRAQIRCVDAMQINDLRGRHVILGPAGAGKSTLALKLAARVAAAGARVVLLAFAPRHEGESVRLQQAASRYGIESALVPDGEALRASMRYFHACDLLLLDLPPLESAHWALLADAEAAIDDEPLLSHLCVPADGAWRGMGEALSRCDFLAVSRCDLASPLVAYLDIAPSHRQSVSFLSAGPAIGEGLSLARKEMLADALADVVVAESQGESRERAGGAA